MSTKKLADGNTSLMVINFESDKKITIKLQERPGGRVNILKTNCTSIVVESIKAVLAVLF